MRAPHLRGRQRGLSPVELMIGLVLGLVLVAGLGHLLAGSRQGSRVEQNVQQMQETGRFAVDIVGRELRKAGFRFDRALAPELVFPAAAPFTAAGAVIVGDATSVTLRYQSGGDNWTRTCLGDDVPAGRIVEQTLAVAGGQLTCRARTFGAGAIDATQPLLDNIEDVDITYGVDNDADGFADTYLAAGAVANWGNVVSVNVQLRTVSAEDFVADNPQPFVGFDNAVVTPEDLRLRRTYATVVALRNRLP